MPEDLSLTWWLDPVLGFFAEQAGLDTEDYVSQTGGEGLAVAIEFIADLFLQTLPSKLVQAGVGAAIGSYAIWGPGVNTRLKKELIAIANHMEFRLLDPKPSDMVEIRKNIDGRPKKRTRFKIRLNSSRCGWIGVSSIHNE